MRRSGDDDDDGGPEVALHGDRIPSIAAAVLGSPLSKSDDENRKILHVVKGEVKIILGPASEYYKVKCMAAVVSVCLFLLC